MRRLGWLLLAVASPAAAQTPLYTAGLQTGGFEFREMSFGAALRLQHASQIAFRFAGGAPLTRRLFVDVGTNYGRTHLRSRDGLDVNLNGLTDTQLRAAYTFGRDIGVVSVLLSLPTGKEQVPENGVQLLRSIAQEFLPFPISAYGMGVGITAGAAAAQRFGAWTLGAAGSVRYVGSYSPFSDVAGEYSPGPEARVRLGARRLLGRSTVQVGLTVSTFGTDEFAGEQQFTYRAGPRVIAEAQVAHEFGRIVGRASGWVYYRAQGDSAGYPVPRARERIVQGSSIWSVPLSDRWTLDPGIQTRLWRSQDDAAGWLVALQVGARWWFTQRFAVAPSLRWEHGNLQIPGGETEGFRGLAGALLLRVGG